MIISIINDSNMSPAGLDVGILTKVGEVGGGYNIAPHFLFVWAS